MCQKGWFLLEALRENLFPLVAVLWLLVVAGSSGVPQLVDTSLQSLPLSSHGILPSVSVSVSNFSPSYRDTSHWIRTQVNLL